MQVCTTVFREHGDADGVGEALEPVDNGEEEIVDAPVLELVQTRSENLAASICSIHRPEHLLVARRPSASARWTALLRPPLVADLDPERVEENQRIGRLQRPGLPGRDLLQTASVTALIRSGETSMP